MIATAHSSDGNFFVLLLFMAILAAAFASNLRQGRRTRNRSQELAGLAARLRFDEFNPARDDDFTRGWGFLSPLTRGDDRYAFNILRGKYQEQTLFVFDYFYRTGSGKNEHEHRLTCLMLVCKEAFPRLSIGPENLRAKIASVFGLEDDIKFESAEFSRTFCVRSQDKKFAYDVCHPQMIEYLMANRDLQIDFQGPVILLAFSPQLPVWNVEFNLQRLAQIRSLLPEYLFTQNA